MQRRRDGLAAAALAAALVLVATGCGGADGAALPGTTANPLVTRPQTPGTMTTADPGSVASERTTTTTATQPSTTSPSSSSSATTTTPTPPGLAPADPVCTVVTIPSAGTQLAAERCAPAASTGPMPAALVLNGCGGYEADAAITKLIARALAARGVLALRLDYLGMKPAPPFTYCEAASVVAAAPDLVRGISGAVDGLRADPTVDPARVGAVGYSLGGLGTALVQLGGLGFAEVPSAGFGAIGLLSPVVPVQLADAAKLGKVPPLVLVVGADDRVVGSAPVVALADAARAGGVDVQLDVVAGQGHDWQGASAQRAADELADGVTAHLLAIQPGVRG